jgi:hypothetical protein
MKIIIGAVSTSENDNIFNLQENSTFRGDIDLKNTHVRTLPKNLTVIGDLNICNTKVHELNIKGTKIKTIEQRLLKNVKKINKKQ